MVQVEASKEIRLNLGARNRAILGFLSVDIDPASGADVIADISSLPAYADGSVSEIYASHCLEHFPHTRTMSVLKEWSRVLKPGGILYVAVPDFARTVYLYQRLGGLNQFLVDFIWGGQEYPTAYHMAGFDFKLLSSMLKDAGFHEVSQVDVFPIGDKHDCSRLVSTVDGKSISLNVVGVK
mgnify:CR=1 FL=1